MALITLDPDAIAGFARRHGLEGVTPALLAADPAVYEEVACGIAGANERLARVEQVERFHVLPDEWQPGGDELTATMKLKRRPVEQKYTAEIEALYAG